MSPALAGRFFTSASWEVLCDLGHSFLSLGLNSLDFNREYWLYKLTYESYSSCNFLWLHWMGLPSLQRPERRGQIRLAGFKDLAIIAGENEKGCSDLLRFWLVFGYLMPSHSSHSRSCTQAPEEGAWWTLISPLGPSHSTVPGSTAPREWHTCLVL